MELPAFPREFNLAEYFLDARIDEGRGERVAIEIGDQRWTYAQVQARANRVRHALKARGVGLEDRVLFLLFDGAEFVETWFGTLKAGAVFCMANPLLTHEDLRYLVQYTRAKAIVADVSVLPQLEGIELAHARAKLCVGAHEGPLPLGFEPYEAALEQSDAHTENERTNADDVAGWLFTSGTTGKSKGAIHSHRHFAFNTEVYAKRTLELREDDVFLSVSRLFFGYGTGTNLMFPFALGAKIVLFPEKPTVERLIAHLTRHRVTVLTNVPSMIRQMLDHTEALPPAALDLSSLRMCLSAGEALPPSLYARWRERFPHADIYDGIGSAEMFHIFITNRPGDVRPGSLGKLVEGYQARVVTPEGTDAAPLEIGRLHIRGGSTAYGYFGEEAKTHETFAGPWCFTSDLFRRDAEGYFYYEGRADDLLKVRGQFLSPIELEDCLCTHPAVRECAVIGVDDGEGLVIPKAYIVLREGIEKESDGEGMRALKEALQAHAQSKLTRYKFPREIEFIDELPRNDRGKIMRRALLALHHSSLDPSAKPKHS